MRPAARAGTGRAVDVKFFWHVSFAIALVAVTVLPCLTMRFSGVIHRILRPSGVELPTRIAGLLLAAIAVQLVVGAIRSFVTGG